MKAFYSLFILFLFGCVAKQDSQVAEYNTYVDALSRQIQINPIPHPLNLGGVIPYVVWVDGQRMPLKPGRVRKLAVSLGLPLNVRGTPEMHAGAGWLEPHNLTKK